MIDERTIELIHAAMDGELDDGGRAELDALLEASAEARSYREQMHELSAFLDQAPAVEVPDELYARIVERVVLPAVKDRFGWLRFGQSSGLLRYGLAAAAGLLLAVGIYEFRPGQGAGQDFSDMVGTIMPGGRAGGDLVLDSFSFDIEQLSSVVSLERRDGRLVLDVQLDSTEPVEITVDFTSDGLQFDAIAQLDSDINLIEVADRAIQVRSSGRQHFAVLLHRDESDPGSDVATIALNYSSDGKLLNSGKLKTQ